VIQLSYGYYDRAQTIHAIALFPGYVQRAMAAANALAAKLRDPNVIRDNFDRKLFGTTHFETVGEPFLVSRGLVGLFIRPRGWRRTRLLPCSTAAAASVGCSWLVALASSAAPGCVYCYL